MLSVAMRQRMLPSLDHCSPFISLLWDWCPWVGLYVSQLQVFLMVSLNRRRGRPLFLWPEDSWQQRICFGGLSGDILMGCQVHRRFFLINISSTDDSPTVGVIPCLSLCRLYTVHASAPYMRVDSTTARYIMPLTRTVTWWLFQC